MGQTPVAVLLKTGNKRNSFTRQNVLVLVLVLVLAAARLGSCHRPRVGLATLLDRPDDSASDLVGHDSGILLAV